jgi:hypothetical protein
MKIMAAKGHRDLLLEVGGHRGEFCETILTIGGAAGRVSEVTRGGLLAASLCAPSLEALLPADDQGPVQSRGPVR